MNIFLNTLFLFCQVINSKKISFLLFWIMRKNYDCFDYLKMIILLMKKSHQNMSLYSDPPFVYWTKGVNFLYFMIIFYHDEDCLSLNLRLNLNFIF